MCRQIDSAGTGPAVDPDPVSIAPDIDPAEFNRLAAAVDQWSEGIGKGPGG